MFSLKRAVRVRKQLGEHETNVIPNTVHWFATGNGAAGSALRSGRRGPRFKSGLPEIKKGTECFFNALCSFFLSFYTSFVPEEVEYTIFTIIFAFFSPGLVKIKEMYEKAGEVIHSFNKIY